jgi:hypothetical protein
LLFFRKFQLDGLPDAVVGEVFDLRKSYPKIRFPASRPACKEETEQQKSDACRE